jgi:hypothetical protein
VIRAYTFFALRSRGKTWIARSNCARMPGSDFVETLPKLAAIIRAGSRGVSGNGSRRLKEFAEKVPAAAPIIKTIQDTK